MSKFKVGDKVRILDGSKIERYTGAWNKEFMGRHVGKVHEITNIFEHWGNSPYTAYSLDVKRLCGGVVWDERGLELVTEQKFKVGDKVRAKKDTPYLLTTNGWVGTVVSAFGNNTIDVRGEHFKGTPANRSKGFHVECKYFDLVQPDNKQKIVITTDGKTTTATLYDDKQKVKSAEAKCAPSDTFDFNYGASLALDRLTGFVRGSVDNTLTQMDRFLAGEVGLEIPTNKTMDFLKECERHGLRWYSGDKPTTFNPGVKYFVCENNHLFYSIMGRDNSNYIWETWNGKTSEKR